MSALTDRDNNITPTSNPENKQSAGGEENKPQDTQEQQHKSVVEHKSAIINDKQYVSPSDAILSPASQKLTSFKQRQINKQGAKNPAARTLFARTPSGASSGFDDVDVLEKKST